MANREFKSFYKTVGGNEGAKCHYPTRLDTYGCGCQHACSYCLSPDTDILMYDGTSKKLKDVQIGDELVGVKKEDEHYYTFTRTTVTNKTVVKKPAYKITLKNGNTLICSEDHQWLTNRGWKYTTGEMVGENRRPYITTANQMLGFYSLFNVPQYQETDMYKMGYLRGVVLGDANFKEYHYDRKCKKNGEPNGETQYHFRLVLKDENITARASQYLHDFGIIVSEFPFPMIDRQTKERYYVTAIRTASKEYYDRIHDLIQKRDDAEFVRGFISGIYDAEGSTSDIMVRRFYNTNQEIINDICEGLEKFGFIYTFDKDTITINNKITKTVRIVGGISENLRFSQIFQTAYDSYGLLERIKLKSYKSTELKIESIQKYADDIELIDITTTTRNFIANGVVSHNCYAKSLLSFRGMWDEQHPAVADIEKIRRKIKSIAKAGDVPVVRLGGMTDCFQGVERDERVTYETIKALNEAGIEYLIVTKSDLVADDAYMDIMDKDLAHIQVTVTCFDDKKYEALHYEKAPVPSLRIKAIEKLQRAGFDVALRLSPFIPEFVDYDVLNSVECDKLLVEFLRVNSWIQKWFDIDYSPYTLKEGSYRHLPLETKIELLKNIKNFKEITVCEDESEAYEYWNKHFNPNPDDCCNLRH